MEVEINQDALGLRMCQFCFTNCMLSCSNRLPLSLYQNLVCFEMQQTQKKKKMLAHIDNHLLSLCGPKTFGTKKDFLCIDDY